MQTVTITDGVSLNATLDLKDGSALAEANPKQFLATDKDLFEALNLPVNQTSIKSIALGATFTSPNLLSGDLKLNVLPGMNCGLTVIRPADKLLFADDGFSPKIAVNPNQAWLGFELDVTLGAQLSATDGAFGVSFAIASKASACTWTLVCAAVPPLPKLLDALQTALANYSVLTSPAAIREQLADTVCTTEVSGCVTASVSVQQPFTLNPLASANLPFNEKASVEPCVTAELSSSVKITGDFIVRSYKISGSLVRLGVYKQRGVTLTVELEAGAGLGGDLGKTEVLNKVLNAALPGVDLAAAGITGSTAEQLNGVIKTGLSRSLSAQLNATCSASDTDEAALLYDIHLDQGEPTETDTALKQAMGGDWTALHGLSNATCLRNVAVETVSKKSALSLNLFGFYNALSATDYVRKSTILVDESGQLSMIDKLDTSRISASIAPDASDSEKLRRALVEDFLCTATYAAVSGRLQLNLTAMQSYFDLKQSMGAPEMWDNVRLGSALGLITPSKLDGALSSVRTFNHACVSATVRYESPALMSIFYKDPATQTLRSQTEIENVGRLVMASLLDPNDGPDAVRLQVLNSDALWQQMDDNGDPAAFHTIGGLSQLPQPQLGAVIADWVTIRWWAKALAKVAPALSAALNALNAVNSADPAHDPGFVTARANLANVLGSVTRNTDGGFVHGWGEAVLFALSGNAGTAAMDLTWSGKSLHFPS